MDSPEVASAVPEEKGFRFRLEDLHMEVVPGCLRIFAWWLAHPPTVGLVAWAASNANYTRDPAREVAQPTTARAGTTRELSSWRDRICVAGRTSDPEFEKIKIIDEATCYTFQICEAFLILRKAPIFTLRDFKHTVPSKWKKVSQPSLRKNHCVRMRNFIWRVIFSHLYVLF